MSSNFSLKKKVAIAATSGLLGLLGYPAFRSVYPIKEKVTVDDEYVDLPTATADLTKDILLPESIGTSNEIPVDVSHWILLTLLNSKDSKRRDRALQQMACQRRWNDAECLEIAQALNHENIIRLARTPNADIRLFLPPPSMNYLEQTFQIEDTEQIVKTILRKVHSPNMLALNDLNHVDHNDESVRRRKRPKWSAYNQDVVELKAVLNNVICSEEQAMIMVEDKLMFALLYFRQKYKNDIVINGLLAQILTNLSSYKTIREKLFLDGWVQILLEYSRSSLLELSMPAIKALANLDSDCIDKYGVYGNHIYLLHPQFRQQTAGNLTLPQGSEPSVDFDIIFVHGLVGSVFKSWRQGTLHTDRENSEDDATELMPTISDKPIAKDNIEEYGEKKISPCWPKDWLARDVPNIRILAVDYPTALTSWKTDCDLNKDTLEQRANHVMKQLEKAKVGERPIVWITHSMGGLLVKQILVLSYQASQQMQQENKKPLKQLSKEYINSENERPSETSFEQKLLSQTKGIVFYSVPHRGSNLDWIERKNLQKLLMLTTEVIELQKDSPLLLNLHKKFLDLLEKSNETNNDKKALDVKFLSFIETAASNFKVNKVMQWRGVLVHEDSLRFEHGPCYKLNIDHAHSCKPSSKTSLTYTKTLDLIRGLMPHKEADKKEEFLPFISYLL